MRKNIKARPTVGKQRIKKRFLWLPKALPREDGVKKEKRWLETAEWIQEFTETAGGLIEGGSIYWWRDIDWLDKQEGQ